MKINTHIQKIKKKIATGFYRTLTACEEFRKRDILYSASFFFLMLAFFLPKPDSTGKTVYASETDALMAFYLSTILLVYFIVMIFIGGYNIGVKRYKPKTKASLSKRQFEEINKQLKAGTNVTITVSKQNEVELQN